MVLYCTYSKSWFCTVSRVAAGLVLLSGEYHRPVMALLRVLFPIFGTHASPPFSRKIIPYSHIFVQDHPFDPPSFLSRSVGEVRCRRLFVCCKLSAAVLSDEQSLLLLALGFSQGPGPAAGSHGYR
jgi:hypothetical protein